MYFFAQAARRLIIGEDVRFPGTAALERIILPFQMVIVAGFAVGVNALWQVSLPHGIADIKSGGAVTLC